ncbi:MAG: hypothetical protein J6A04_04740 [Clostridia bacterium]|nr:hypothetical protein [Clostridia bacterium]
MTKLTLRRIEQVYSGRITHTFMGKEKNVQDVREKVWDPLRERTRIKPV